MLVRVQVWRHDLILFVLYNSGVNRYSTKILPVLPYFDDDDFLTNYVIRSN